MRSSWMNTNDKYLDLYYMCDGIRRSPTLARNNGINFLTILKKLYGSHVMSADWHIVKNIMFLKSLFALANYLK